VLLACRFVGVEAVRGAVIIVAIDGRKTRRRTSGYRSPSYISLGTVIIVTIDGRVTRRRTPGYRSVSSAPGADRLCRLIAHTLAVCFACAEYRA